MSNQTVVKLVLVSCFLGVFSSFAVAVETRITWASDPVNPDEAVLVNGWDFSRKITVEVARVIDGEVGLPDPAAKTAKTCNVSSWQRVTPLQPTPSAFKFVLPASFEPGVFLLKTTGVSDSDTHLINAPDVWWVHGDEVTIVNAGKWLAVFGKCLSFPNASASMAIKGKGSDSFTKLTVTEATPEKLQATVPNVTKGGTYEVYVHNGFGDQTMWVNAGEIVVRNTAPKPEKIYNVTDFGVKAEVQDYYSWEPDPFKTKTDSSDAIQKAFDAAGKTGGMVFFPRGNYICSKMLHVPKNITIRGAGQRLTAIEWSDVDPPRPACLYGVSNFIIEDISLYALNHYAVVRGNSGIETDSGNIKIRRVTIRADRFITCQTARHYDNFKEILAQRTKDCARVGVMNFGGENIEITDCDLYSPRLTLTLDKISGIIKNNRFKTRPEHWHLFIRGANKVIFQGNEVLDAGASISSVHHFPVFTPEGKRGKGHQNNPRACYVYCAENKFRDSYTKDRDGGVNSDYHSPLGLYFEKVKKVEGDKITFAGKFWSGTTHWLGCVVVIADGKGAGQYRNVVSFVDDKTLIVDRDCTWDNNVVVGTTLGFIVSYVNPSQSFLDERLAKLEAMDYDVPGSAWYQAYPETWQADYSDPSVALKSIDSVAKNNVGFDNYKFFEEWSPDAFSWFADVSNNLDLDKVPGENIGFYDESSLCLAIREDSPAFTIPGFERIPWELIGRLDPDKEIRPVPPNGFDEFVTEPSGLYWAPAFNAASHRVYLRVRQKTGF